MDEALQKKFIDALEVELDGQELMFDEHEWMTLIKCLNEALKVVEVGSITDGSANTEASHKLAQSNSKSEDTLSKSNDNLYSTTDQLSNDYKVPPQDTVSMEDIMHATPKGREVVMKAIENSIEVQNKMTKKAQDTLKESNNLNTSEEHIKDTSLDVDWNDLIGQDMSAYEAKENIKILKKTIAAWHKQQQIKLIERIEGEVIGSKENYNFDNMERASVIYRNKLRAKQRQALKKIKESING